MGGCTTASAGNDFLQDSTFTSLHTRDKTAFSLLCRWSLSWSDFALVFPQSRENRGSTLIDLNWARLESIQSCRWRWCTSGPLIERGGLLACPCYLSKWITDNWCTIYQIFSQNFPHLWRLFYEETIKSLVDNLEWITWSRSNAQPWLVNRGRAGVENVFLFVKRLKYAFL